MRKTTLACIQVVIHALAAATQIDSSFQRPNAPVQRAMARLAPHVVRIGAGCGGERDRRASKLGGRNLTKHGFVALRSTPCLPH